MRVISESEELAQGVKIFFVGVLSFLAVDEAFSFYTKTFGSRAPRLQPGGVPAGNCMPGNKILEPALVCAHTVP